MQDKILLIDGHNAMWRASSRIGRPVPHHLCTVDTHKEKHMYGIHCACGSPWNKDGDFCYGDKFYLVYSFFRNLRPIIEKFKPEKCFFVLEGHPKFRYDLFPEYKANRKPSGFIKSGEKSQETLDQFSEQSRIVIDLIKKLPITSIRAANYECDDLIASLCDDMKDEELTVLSNDSDFIQLLQRGYSNINIYNPIKKEFMVAPEYHYVGWKCLSGDSSDNIPKLLTPKKALKTISNPELFRKFLMDEKNKSLFDRNRDLIELKNIPMDNLEIFEGISDFTSLKNDFASMKFESIINDKSWAKFTETFSCIQY